MGEYAEFKINGVDLYSLKNDSAAHPTLMEVFSPKDIYRYDTDENGFHEEKHVFRTKVEFAIERLDILGFTLNQARTAINEAVEKYNANPVSENLPLWDRDSIDYWDEGENPPDGVPDIVNSIADWNELRKAYAQFFADRHTTDNMRYHRIEGNPYYVDPVNAFADEMFTNESFCGLRLMIDSRLELRIILESMQKDQLIEYDYSNVVEFWDDIEPVLLEELNNTVFSDQNKTTILLEGKSDDEFLMDALELLHPEVSYLFKSYSYRPDAKPERSAEALCKFGKSLIAVGSSERYVLVFDNDIAGLEAKDKLPRKLPRNIAALALPDLGFANRYPTIDLNGRRAMTNINGRACAIETYLGENLISDDHGEYLPIFWRENQGAKGRHGSYEKKTKEAIQKKYREIVSQAKSNGLDSIYHDWSGLEIVLSEIFETSSHLGNEKAL